MVSVGIAWQAVLLESVVPDECDPQNLCRNAAANTFAECPSVTTMAFVDASPGTHLDADSWFAACVAAQVCPHDRQQAHHGRCGQCAQPAVRASLAQSGMGLRHHRHPHAKRLALPSSRAGLALPQDSGLGDESGHACWIGLCSFADGYRSKKSSAGADRAFRPRHAIRQR